MGDTDMGDAVRGEKGPRRLGTRRKASATGVAFAVAVLLASCGSDNKSSSSAATTAAPAAATTAAATATTGGAATTSGGAAATTAAAATVDMAPKGCDAVTIGVIVSSSGPYSNLGTDSTIAADAFSKAHPDILGTPLKLQVENDNSDPTTAVAAAQRLMADPCVVAISGPGAGATQTAAMSVLVAGKKPVIVATPVTYANYNKEPYIFSPNLTPVPMQTDLFVAYFDAVGAKKPVVITGDDATGDAVAKIYPTKGVPVERVPIAVTDYEPKIAELKAAGYDAVGYLGASGAPAGQIALAKKTLGWDVPLFLPPSVLTGDFLKVAGDAAEGTRGFIWPAGLGADKVSPQEQADAVKEIQGAVATDIDLALRPIITLSWDNYNSLYLAMKEAKSTDAAALQKVLDTQNFYGAGGEVIRIGVDQPNADHAGVQIASATRAIVKDAKLVAADQ